MEGRRQRRFATRWQLLVYIPPVHLEVTADLRLLITLAHASVWNSLQIIYGLTIDNSQFQALVEDISV